MSEQAHSTAQRKEAIKSRMKRGDQANAARIVSAKYNIPTTRDHIWKYMQGRFSRVEFYYLEALEKVQQERER